MAGEHESVELVGDATVEHVAKAALIAALTAALAQVSIPIPSTGVPFSLQPFGAFFAGLLLGPLWGGLAMTLYVLAGIAGAPVYSNGAAGLGYLFGPTGGFLVGFLVGAVAIGAIAHRGVDPRPLGAVSVPVQIGALAIGLVIFYAVGVPWMATVLGIPLGRAAATMAPYVPPDAVKLLIAVGIVQSGALVRG
jgi:biotin transport system substrate-specific component